MASPSHRCQWLDCNEDAVSEISGVLTIQPDVKFPYCAVHTKEITSDRLTFGAVVVSPIKKED